MTNCSPCTGCGRCRSSSSSHKSYSGSSSFSVPGYSSSGPSMSSGYSVGGGGPVSFSPIYSNVNITYSIAPSNDLGYVVNLHSKSSYTIDMDRDIQFIGGLSDYASSEYKTQPSKEELEQNFKTTFIPGHFLKPERNFTPFIGKVNEISHHIEDAFVKTTGKHIPRDISIRVVNVKEIKKLMPTWHPGISGFCMNKVGFGISEVVVLESNLDELMLTIGHEIGHALSKTMPNKIDEEAKAFSFSLAWINTIKQHDIGNIGKNILPNPAENGLHDVAFNFVVKNLKKDNNPLELFHNIIRGNVSIAA
ncbi:hypothetical protein ACFL1H_00270 [Nanoarchaeota archaeon]